MNSPKKLFIAGILIILIIDLSCKSNPSRVDNETRNNFQKLTQEWKAAYNSKNSQNLSPLYSPDAQYISGHVNGLVADGRENILKYFQEGINNGGHLDYIEILNVNISCDIATLLCKYQATNSGVTVEGRNLLVMKKVKDRWLIIQHLTVV